MHELPPPRTGRSGRPRTRGARLGTPTDLVASATAGARWRDTRVRRYGRTDAVQITELICLWYSAFRSQTVRVILIRDDKPRTRDRDDRGYGLPLVTSDLESTAEDLVARYASRWGIEQAFADARQIVGVGEARNRTRRAVERIVPFGMSSCPRPPGQRARLANQLPRRRPAPAPRSGRIPDARPRRRAAPAIQDYPRSRAWMTTNPSAAITRKDQIRAVLLDNSIRHMQNADAVIRQECRWSGLSCLRDPTWRRGKAAGRRIDYRRVSPRRL